MIQGFATSEGTRQFADNSKVNKANFKIFKDLTLSNVGIGTYLGNADSQTDDLVSNAVKQSITSGINVIDTAINYRSQRAERSVGRALSSLIQDKVITRDQIFISTKNGYVTNDAEVNLDFWDYVQKEYVKRGVIGKNDITSGYHCMTPSYMSDQLDRSLKNLGLECIDLMYIHNAVEGQIKDISQEQLLKNLERVFELYEQKRDEGKISYYGMATWECFRVPTIDPQHLHLEDIIAMAAKVGGEKHGFRFIQLPFNMYYDQAYLGKNQRVGEEREVSILDAAITLGIGVFTSVPFMQGRLLQPNTMPNFDQNKPALRALQFLRSTPGVLAPLAGQKLPEHVSENTEIMNIPPLSNDEFNKIIKKLV